MSSIYCESKATFSFLTRVKLERIWDVSLPTADIIMFNPSTANSILDDVTTHRCYEILKNNGYGGFSVYNVSNDTVNIYVPSDNDIIVAWGNKIKPKISEKIIESYDKKVFW